MKRLSILAILAVFVLGMAASALAADIKVSGKWQIEATNRVNNDFTDARQDNTFNIEQRMRTAFTFIANENLKAVLDTQIGSANWGSGLYEIGAGRSNTASTTLPGNSANGGSGNIMLRKGYIDFKYPGTKVNFLVGYQTIALPAAFGGGSAIIDDQMAAAVMVTPLTDNLKLLAGFARLVDAKNANAATVAAGSTPTNLDAVFAALPIDFKGFNITPFGLYATGGSGLNSAALQGLSNNATGAIAGGLQNGMKAYWGGVAFTMTAFEPFKVMADFNYGSAKYDNDPALNPNQKGGRAGYMFDIAVQYTGLKMMTPEAFFVYSSGEGSDGTNSTDGKSDRMPVVANPQNWAVGSFFFGDRDFIYGFPQQSGYYRNVAGFWTAGLSLKNMSFIDKLTHTAHLLYVKGTNDVKTVNTTLGYNGLGSGKTYGAYLTTKDSLWEVDFNSKYMIYDELSVYLNLGYINSDFDKDTWKAVSLDYNGPGSKDAYRVGLGLAYTF